MGLWSSARIYVSLNSWGTVIYYTTQYGKDILSRAAIKVELKTSNSYFFEFYHLPASNDKGYAVQLPAVVGAFLCKWVTGGICLELTDCSIVAFSDFIIGGCWLKILELYKICVLATLTWTHRDVAISVIEFLLCATDYMWKEKVHSVNFTKCTFYSLKVRKKGFFGI